VLRWLTTDRFLCTDCKSETIAVSRWLDGPRVARCKACGGVSMERRQGLARGLRDLMILTNAA
jgi:hypothetical protein